MILTLSASLFLALIAAGAMAGLYLSWPRQLSAEEWILHRRALQPRLLPNAAPAAVQPRRPRWWRPPDELYRTFRTLLTPDLAVLALFGRKAPRNQAELVRFLQRRALLGGLLGFAAGFSSWLAQGHPIPPWVLIEVGFGSLGLLPALSWIRIRREAAELRAAIDNRLPRLLTAARMLLESGAATPERALSEAAAIHDDPAADVIREALRMREVRRLEIEDAIEEVAGRYSLVAMRRLADGFRVGRRYGTGMSHLLGEYALDLRAYQHQLYRERITRAPILMTVPALIFFVAPLLVLILYLVFSPLLHTLGEL